MEENYSTGTITSKYKNTLVFAWITYLLILSPLFQAGVEPLPLIFLEIGGLVLLGIVVWLSSKTDRLWRFSKPGCIFLWLAFLFPLLHLLPIPWKLWTSLPGHDIYSQFVSLVQANDFGWRSIAVIPYVSETAWLALIPPFAIFAGVIFLPKSYHKQLIAVAVSMAVLEALIGLMQFSAGAGSPACFGNTLTCGESAVGTYINRDHFAGFLEMLLPVAIAMMIASMGRNNKQHHHYRSSWLQSLLVLANWQERSTLLYTLASVAILVGIIFTRSRMGITLAMLGILLTPILFTKRISGKGIKKSLGIIAALGLVIAIEVGLVPVLQRFVMEDPLKDSRWEIFSSAVKAIADFLPIGTGIGSFSEIFYQYAPVTLGEYDDIRAHNDYLEWILEGGLLGALILLGWIFLYFFAGFRSGVISRNRAFTMRSYARV